MVFHNFNMRLQAWLNSCRGPDGQVQAERIAPLPPDRGPLGFEAFFNPLSRLDRSLCALIVNHALTINVDARMSAAGVALRARVLLQSPTTPKVAQELIAVMRTEDTRNDLENLAQEAQTLRAWEAATRTTRTPAAHPRGQARPLP